MMIFENDDIKDDVKEYLDSKEFFDLMQEYRWAPITEQAYVINAYEKIEKFIIKMVEELK